MLKSIMRSCVSAAWRLASPLKGTGISRWPLLRSLGGRSMEYLLPEDRVVEYDGHAVELHPALDLVTAKLLLDGEYEPGELAFLRQSIAVGDCAIDVGANVGVLTLEMARLVGLNGRVAAFEPEPSNVEILKRNVARNGYDGEVEVVAAAVGASNGRASLVLAAGGSVEHHLQSHDQADAGAVSLDVEVVTLDEFCNARALAPAFVKIDVEGAELQVLRGMRRLLDAGRRMSILSEYSPARFDAAGDSAAEYLSFMKDYRFEPRFVESIRGRPVGDSLVALASVAPTDVLNVGWVREDASP